MNLFAATFLLVAPMFVATVVRRRWVASGGASKRGIGQPVRERVVWLVVFAGLFFISAVLSILGAALLAHTPVSGASLIAACICGFMWLLCLCIAVLAGKAA